MSKRICVLFVHALALFILGGFELAHAQGSRAGTFWQTGFAPSALSFTNQTGVALGATITSNSVTLTGTGTRPVTATCTGCTVERNNSGTFAATVSGFKTGDTIRIRITSSSSANTAVTSSVKVGTTTSSTWSVTTTTPANPTGLSLTQTASSKVFNVSWTAGAGNGGSGGCKLQFYTGSAWSDITSATSVDCDSNSSNASYSLNGDGWKSNWSGTQVRLVRKSDSTAMGTFSQTLTCTTGGWTAWTSGGCTADGSDWLYYGKPWSQSGCQDACKALGKTCATFPPDANCACSTNTSNSGASFLMSTWSSSGGSSVPTPNVDEDCNGVWDNSVTSGGSWSAWAAGGCTADGSDWLYYGKPWSQSGCQDACKALGKTCATFPPDANCSCSTNNTDTGAAFLRSVYTPNTTYY